MYLMLRKLVLKFPKRKGFLPPPRSHTGTLTCGSGDRDGRAPAVGSGATPGSPHKPWVHSSLSGLVCAPSRGPLRNPPPAPTHRETEAVLEPTFIVLAALPLDSSSHACCVIYTYTHMYTHGDTPTAHTCSTDDANRAGKDCKNVAFANSTGGRFTTKITKQTGQSVSHGFTAQNMRKE